MIRLEAHRISVLPPNVKSIQNIEHPVHVVACAKKQ